jgi:hypothetical protein
VRSTKRGRGGKRKPRWQEKAKGLIKDHVAVSPEDLFAIQERFREVLSPNKPLPSPNKPLPACASCGTRCMATAKKAWLQRVDEQLLALHVEPPGTPHNDKPFPSSSQVRPPA